MKRLLLALLLVFMLSLTIPTLRARALPKYSAAAAWVWTVIDGPMTPILTPWRKVETQYEMGQIITQLVVQRNRGRPPPTNDELPSFMQREALDSTATDMWGKRYLLLSRPDSVYLRSAGPDTIFDTEDDIIDVVRYPSPYRRSGRRR